MNFTKSKWSMPVLFLVALFAIVTWALRTTPTSATDAHWTDIDFKTHGDCVIRPLGLQSDTTIVEGEDIRIEAVAEVWYCRSHEMVARFPIPRYVLATEQMTFPKAWLARPNP